MNANLKIYLQELKNGSKKIIICNQYIKQEYKIILMDLIKYN